jgi:heptosyltransferase I
LTSSPLLAEPPRSVAVLKLSAIGDICHTLPVVRTLQREWPATRFSWIIGRAEATLVGGIGDIDFIVVDKRSKRRGLGRVAEALAARPFDVLLHMQYAWRASMIARRVRAPIKVGYDRERALDLQWLFTTHRIEPGAREHVMDGLYGFARRLGVAARDHRWDIPVPQSARERAERLIPDDAPTLIVSPCSSHPVRNWRAEHYAAVADHAARALGWRVVLCGGPSALEAEMGARIAEHMREPVLDLIGRDTLIELYALLGRAAALLTPDSGPAHMATAAGTPVVGLYASTSAERSGPYFSREWCVDRFDAAARRYLGRSAAELPWRTKIERAGVMDLIEPDAVIERLGALAASRSRRAPLTVAR